VDLSSIRIDASYAAVPSPLPQRHGHLFTQQSVQLHPSFLYKPSSVTAPRQDTTCSLPACLTSTVHIHPTHRFRSSPLFEEVAGI